MSQHRVPDGDGAGVAELLPEPADLIRRPGEALGPKAQHFAALDDGSTLPQDMPLALQGALYSRVTTIYGGSSEIQRNIIARRALGL